MNENIIQTKKLFKETVISKDEKITQLSHDLKDTKQALKETTEERDAFEAQCNETQSRLDTANEEIAWLKDQLDGKNEQLRQLKMELHTATQTLTGERGTIEKMKKDLESALAMHR